MYVIFEKWNCWCCLFAWLGSCFYCTFFLALLKFHFRRMNFIILSQYVRSPKGFHYVSIYISSVNFAPSSPKNSWLSPNCYKIEQIPNDLAAQQTICLSPPTKGPFLLFILHRPRGQANGKDLSIKLHLGAEVAFRHATWLFNDQGERQIVCCAAKSFGICFIL